MDILLPYRAPYDWPAMLDYLRTRAITGVESVEGDTYRRAIAPGGVQGTIAVRPSNGAALRATIRCSRPAALPGIIARLGRVFDLAADLDAISRHFADDPVLAPLLALRPGLRVPGAWDGFEVAIRAVLGQQITVVAAVRLAGKLVAAHGERLAEPEFGLTHCFPRPEAMAGVDLSVLGMPRSRAATLSALAEAVLADPDLFGAAGAARLRAVPGIGDWTAQYIAMRARRAPDAFPAADIGLARALAGADGVRPTPLQLLARAERWRPWRAYAAQHLWTAKGIAGVAGSGTVGYMAPPGRRP